MLNRQLPMIVMMGVIFKNKIKNKISLNGLLNIYIKVVDKKLNFNNNNQIDLKKKKKNL